MQARILPLSVNAMHHQRLSNNGFYHHPATVLPSSQTMVINNNPAASVRMKRDTHSCDDIVDHCNNNGDTDNSSSRNNPYAKVSLEKLSRNCFVLATPPPMPHPLTHPQAPSYHPHSIFYGQHYHRIQPTTACNATTFGNNYIPIQLTDRNLSDRHSADRHSGSSFRSSNTQSPPSMMDEEMKLPADENPYECIPALTGRSFPLTQPPPQEAVTRFDN